MGISVVYNADAERAAQNICSVLNSAREKAMAQNEGSETADAKVRIIARMTQKDDDNNYIGVYKVTTTSPGATPTEELLEEVKLSNYKVQIYAGTKNTDPTNLTGCVQLVKTGEAAGDATKKDKLEYSFKKGTGFLTVAGSSVSGEEYLDIIVSGSETYKLIVSKVSGRCYFSE